jgi:uncharacterized zinc-type alcohol dehydrogenase-like protein
MCRYHDVYSPLRHWRAGPGTHVAIIGFGGLGHVGVQIVRAMDTQVAVPDLDDDKRGDALRLGDDAFHVSADPGTFHRPRQ